ncbi:unnamed protein product [Sphagnum troendelagicum]|uniref:Uncharacterized protein n=1 Tax=Sphagnum troendelagicum TaxID=128251 RepID=A0ABP0TQZ9_9BRYO
MLIENRLDGGLIFVRLDEIAMLLLDLVDGVLIPVHFDQVHIERLQDVAEEHDSEHADRCEYVVPNGINEHIEVALSTKSLITDEQLERFKGDELIESLEVVRHIEVSELGVHIDAAQLVHHLKVDRELVDVRALLADEEASLQLA